MPNINGVNYPTGSIDFSKPLVTEDGDAVNIITVLPAGEYPVLVQVAGEEQIEQINGNGDTLSGSFEVQNGEEGPKVVYGVLLGDSSYRWFHDGVYDSEDAARSANSTETIIAVFPVTIPVATADNDLTSVELNGRTIKVGDTVRAYRRGFGDREANVIKVRNDVRKSLYIQPDDGSNAYWALNRNIRSY